MKIDPKTPGALHVEVIAADGSVISKVAEVDTTSRTAQVFNPATRDYDTVRYTRLRWKEWADEKVHALFPELAAAIAAQDFPAESREPVEHELKCWPPFFEDVTTGRKPFEVRHLDRDYRPGDTLRLREFYPAPPDSPPEFGGAYTGRECRRRITYILRSEVPKTRAGSPPPQMAVMPGYGVLGIEPEIPAVRPERLPDLWFVYYEEHKDDGSQVVAARNEATARRIGALALGMDRDDPDGIAAVPCDPHELYAEVKRLRVAREVADAYHGANTALRAALQRCAAAAERGDLPDVHEGDEVPLAQAIDSALAYRVACPFDEPTRADLVRGIETLRVALLKLCEAAPAPDMPHGGKMPIHYAHIEALRALAETNKLAEGGRCAP